MRDRTQSQAGLTARITVAALFIVPAAMAYPWPTTVSRILLGAAVVVVVLLFGRWRGLFLPDIVGRRFAVWRRNHTKSGHAKRPPAEYATAVVRIEGAGVSELPLNLIAGYLDRYGLQADKVRVSSLDGESGRTTWVSLTLGAVENMAALQARSAQLPLRETTTVAGRRLADHLRESGFTVTMVDADDEAPAPVPAKAKETWCGLRDDSGYVAAYRIAANAKLAKRLEEVWSREPLAGTWTAIEISGTAAHPRIASACALHTDKRPFTLAPVRGLRHQRGRQWPALDALDPRSERRLEAETFALRSGLLDEVHWRVESDKSVKTAKTDEAETGGTDKAEAGTEPVAATSRT